jgi:CHRD domain
VHGTIVEALVGVVGADRGSIWLKALDVSQIAAPSAANRQRGVVVKRLLIGVVVAVLSGAVAAEAAAVSAAGEPYAAAPKITICHNTGSTTNPYRRIVVSARARTNPKSQSGRLLRAHLRHAGDVVVSGDVACPNAVLRGVGGTILRAKLEAVGAAVGSGTAFLRIKGTQVCYVLKLSGTTAPLTASHVHQTSTGGNIVVPLTIPANANAAAVGCVQITQTLAQTILANTSDFYVNVHTTGGTVILTGPLAR